MNGKSGIDPLRPAGFKARVREIGGFALISVGLAGLLVPVIPGIPLIAAGVGVLGSEHSFVRRWRIRLEEKGLLKAQPSRIAETKSL